MHYLLPHFWNIIQLYSFLGGYEGSRSLKKSVELKGQCMND